MSELHEGAYWNYMMKMEKENKEPMSFEEWAEDQAKNMKKTEKEEQLTFIKTETQEQAAAIGKALVNAYGYYFAGAQRGDYDLFGVYKNGKIKYAIQVKDGELVQVKGEANIGPDQEDIPEITAWANRNGISAENCQDFTRYKGYRD